MESGKRFILVLVSVSLATTILQIQLHSVHGYPSPNPAPASSSYSDGWSIYHNRIDTVRRSINECENSIEVRELCQRCAKVTKSRYAYPMCCERRENTREWCIKFLNFGLSSNFNSGD